MNLSEAQKTLIAKLGKEGLPRAELSAEECKEAHQLGKYGAVILRWKGLAEDRYAATLQGLAAIQPPECAPVGADVGSQAARDVLAERRRQVEAEGWTPEHDDAHDDGSLARAASCYAERAALASQCVAHGAHSAGEVDGEVKHQIPANWPWNGNWWKFGDRRRALVKAGALILAEIERLDREEAATPAALVGSGAGRGAADA